jgi:exonuclease VII small subunit
VRNLARVTKGQGPPRSEGDALSRTGEHVRVARDQLARARQHLEQARKRLQRARGKGDKEPG